MRYCYFVLFSLAIFCCRPHGDTGGLQHEELMLLQQRTDVLQGRIDSLVTALAQKNITEKKGKAPKKKPSSKKQTVLGQRNSTATYNWQSVTTSSSPTYKRPAHGRLIGCVQVQFAAMEPAATQQAGEPVRIMVG